MDDDRSLPLIDRFAHLSSHLGTFSIIQEELDCLKQILVEKQDELTKLQSHFESSQQADRSNFVDESDDDDDDELTEILHFQSRTPSRQSVTPGEKQQLIAQNELLSSLLIDKEQELISFQQTEKTFDALRNDLQQSTRDREMKDKELNDIRNILDEKLRENSSLRKEKIYFIERITDFERERQTISTDQHVSLALFSLLFSSSRFALVRHQSRHALQRIERSIPSTADRIRISPIVDPTEERSLSAMSE